MRTADIEVGKTYLEKSSYSSDIYEVLEIQTQEQRHEALRSENSDKHWGRSHAARQQSATIRVRVVGYYHPTSGVVSMAKSPREEWLRPQKLDREIDLDEFRRGVEERKQAHEALKAEKRARVEAIQSRLADTGLPLPNTYSDGSVSREVSWALNDYDRLIELLDESREAATAEALLIPRRGKR